MTASLLDTVVAAARRSAGVREARMGRDALHALADPQQPDGASFVASLRAPGIRVIAECKRRSPSRGVLRHDYDPVAIARAYAAHGAAAISVLTEPTFFDGSLEHLRRVRTEVTVPLLRKDFVVCEYQVLEAAAFGAAAVLLIVAALDDVQLRALISAADRCGLATLVEVHDAEELSRAVHAGATVIGVNSRNLRTLEVNVSTLDELGPAIPAGLVAVAESGLKTGADLRRLKGVRYDAFLVGERFMTDADPGAGLARLIQDAEVRSSARPS
jgi:indole-3-glycerol phosphate synthase